MDPQGGPSPSDTPAPREGAPGPLSGWSHAQFAAWFAEQGEPRYRADQAFTAVQRHGALRGADIRTLPAAVRDRLDEAAGPPALVELERQDAADGTQKHLFGLADGKRVESVLIPERGRNTVCVSSQVGCPVRCVFCASGVAGLIRNLSTAEIVEQLLRVAGTLDKRPSHIVMMGMGEPLLNLDAGGGGDPHLGGCEGHGLLAPTHHRQHGGQARPHRSPRRDGPARLPRDLAARTR